jgi:hypothetical protein
VIFKEEKDLTRRPDVICWREVRNESEIPKTEEVLRMAAFGQA